MSSIEFPFKPRRDDPTGFLTVQENLEALALMFQKGVDDGDVLVWLGDRFVASGANIPLDRLGPATATLEWLNPAGTAMIENRYLDGDLHPSFQIKGDGSMYWGSGGSNPYDTHLWRGQAHQLVTENIQLDNGTLDINTETTPLYTIFGTWLDTEAAYRFTIDGNGKQEWGPGGAAARDVSLHRIAVGVLEVTGAMRWVHDWGIWTQGSSAGASAGYSHYVGSDDEARIRIEGDGKIRWGPGGSTPPDVNLYRLNAWTIKSDGSMYTKYGFGVDMQGDTAEIISAWNSGETKQIFMVDDVGKHWWGPGGSTDLDTNLYRQAGELLKTDGSFWVAQGAWFGAATAADIAVGVYVEGDTGYDRLDILAGGKIEWGAGSAAMDTNLYRSAASTLKTDDTFVSGATGSFISAFIADGLSSNGYGMLVKVGGDSQYRFTLGADGSMNWGSGSAAADTNLYRGAANTLRTDDMIYAVGGLELFAKAGAPVDGDFAALGNIICLDTTNSRIYVRVSGTWKYVTLT